MHKADIFTLPLLIKFCVYLYHTKFPFVSIFIKYPFKLSPTYILGVFTVIVQLADFVLLEFLKVIVAVPADLAVTSPELLTVATLVLLLVH